MRYDGWFIIAGIVCLLIGEVLGTWMGVNANFQLAPAHAHLNLVGWVSLALFGLLHRAFPALAGARLAGVQFWLSLGGAALLPIGIAQSILTGKIVLALAGTAAVVLATLLMAIMFVGKGLLAQPA